jgi:excisionase family DNA binding protein
MSAGTKRMIDIRELCATYSLRPWTVRAWCSQRKIPHTKIGAKVLFDVAEIEAWLKAQAVHVYAADVCGAVAIGQA